MRVFRSSTEPFGHFSIDLQRAGGYGKTRPNRSVNFFCPAWSGGMDAETVAHVHDGAKRKQILDGARAVFLSDGFDGASTNDIARVAGVSKGTLYVYFDSKEQLFEALILQDRQQQAERVATIGEPENADEFLRDYGRRLSCVVMRPEMISQVRMVIAATGKFPRLGQVFYEAGPGHGLRTLGALLIKLKAKGQLEFDDAELAAQHFLDLSHAGLLKRLLFGVGETVSEADIGRRVDAAVDVFLRAYGTKASIAR